jgi:hypothetical protein
VLACIYIVPGQKLWILCMQTSHTCTHIHTYTLTRTHTVQGQKLRQFQALGRWRGRHIICRQFHHLRRSQRSDAIRRVPQHRTASERGRCAIRECWADAYQRHHSRGVVQYPRKLKPSDVHRGRGIGVCVSIQVRIHTRRFFLFSYMHASFYSHICMKYLSHVCIKGAPNKRHIHTHIYTKNAGGTSIHTASFYSHICIKEAPTQHTHTHTHTQDWCLQRRMGARLLFEFGSDHYTVEAASNWVSY